MQACTPGVHVYFTPRLQNDCDIALFFDIIVIMEEKMSAIIVGQKLHTPLAAADKDMAGRFLRGGYNQNGYGVPAGAAVDGSFAIDGEGSQGYYVNGGKEAFLSSVASMKDFFEKRSRILGKPIKYVIKPGIGGQHTPFQGIADVFQVIDLESGRIAGEYELGKDYEAALKNALKELGADWDQIAVIPSSKSGSTDETMMVFSEIFYILLKNIAAKEGLDGAVFADTVLDTMHEVNFVGGAEKPSKDLFKGFNLSLVQKNLAGKRLGVKYETIQKIFGVVLGNMFFETTDRPEASRLSAFIRNSGLDKELGENAPGFGAMFDNVGGRWTADLHMMTFLAYHKLNAGEYWNVRYEGIKKVREGIHQANAFGNKILDEDITDIALVVPDELFWFGKAMEQNFNESIWQKGFANLVAIKESAWESQKVNYTVTTQSQKNPNVIARAFSSSSLRGPEGAEAISKSEIASSPTRKTHAPRNDENANCDTASMTNDSSSKAEPLHYDSNSSRLVINISGLAVPKSSFKVVNLGEFKLEDMAKQEIAGSLGELFTTFYGMTHTVGNRLIARALAEQGYNTTDVDLNDLDDPATKVFQRNLYLRQPYVELGKGLLEKKLKILQIDGPVGIYGELKRIKEAAGSGQIESNIKGLNIPGRISNMAELADVINQAVKKAKDSKRKFVPFIYLEGEKFQEEREHLTKLGIEWVMQGTGDQHISYQQVLAQPQKYLPFVISFIPEQFQTARTAIGFAKGYLDNISPNMVRDSFAEASYHALVDPRKDEAGEEVKNAAGIFMRMTDNGKNRAMLTRSFERALEPAAKETVVEEPAVFDHIPAAIMQSSNTGESVRNMAVEKFKDDGNKHLIFVKSSIPEKQLATTTAINLANMCGEYYNKVGGYTSHVVDSYETAVELLAKNPDWNKTNTIVGLVDTNDLEAMSKDLANNKMKDKTKLLAMEKFSEDQFVQIKGFFDLMSVMVQINKPLDKDSDSELIGGIRSLLNEIGIKDVNGLMDALSAGAYFEDPIKFAKNFIIRLLPPAKPCDTKGMKSLYDAAIAVVKSL
ncbi:MAG: hypothetical protein Q8O01_04535 [Candidatus Omnitrophota bacterium]|nr:hypothetical protein [Candidatus Omnitrophota bacterium]